MTLLSAAQADGSQGAWAGPFSGLARKTHLFSVTTGTCFPGAGPASRSPRHPGVCGALFTWRDDTLSLVKGIGQTAHRYGKKDEEAQCWQKGFLPKFLQLWQFSCLQVLTPTCTTHTWNI